MALKLVLGSSSRCHPGNYLDHLEDEIDRLFHGVEEVLFVPFARPGGVSHEEYTAAAAARFQTWGRRLVGLHEFEEPVDAIHAARGVFVGGGNTFVLLRKLYELRIVERLRQRLRGGLPYLGTSAGSNIAGPSIGTTNDMPIVCPPTFDAIGAVPFNLNPHYPALPPDPTHQGETRADRIGEFHCFCDRPVVALHEDGALRIDGEQVELVGRRQAYLFRRGETMQRLEPGPLDRKLLGF